LLCPRGERPSDCRSAERGYELPPSNAACHSPRLQSDEQYHALTGKSVTNFTVARSLLLLRVRTAEISP
jgi:hypothetical protein